MSTIVTRASKTSALTWAEGDANFTNLNTDKIQVSTITATTGKNPLVDADILPIVDSVGGLLNKVTWLNVKATLKTYFDTLYSTAATVASYVSGLIGTTIQGYNANTVAVAPGTSGNLLTSNGSAWTSAAQSKESYIYIREEQTSGTAGGTFTSGAWQTRVLNTEVNDAGASASLASNQITLVAGTYRFQASAPAYNCNGHQLKLKNITDTIDYLGANAYTITGANSIQTRSHVSGRFTIAGSKVFELQHRCATTGATNGLGVADSFGTEVYSQIEFWKEV